MYYTPMGPSVSKAEQARKTREAILAEAKSRFSKHGFSQTRFDEISKTLNMTAGVMYHHFDNKKDLFHAVVEIAHQQVQRVVEASADAEASPLDGLIAGCVSFIKEASSKELRQILLVDALAVLGWQDWKQLDEKYSEKSLCEGLEHAKSLRAIPKSTPTEALARLISGGCNDLALWVAASSRREQCLKEAEKVISILFEGLNLVSEHRSKND